MTRTVPSLLLCLTALAAAGYFYGSKRGAGGTPRSLLLWWSIGSILQLVGLIAVILPKLNAPRDGILGAVAGISASIALLGAYQLGCLMRSPGDVVRDRADLPPATNESMDRFGHQLAQTLTVGTAGYAIYCLLTGANFFSKLGLLAGLSTGTSIVYAARYLRERFTKRKSQTPETTKA